MLRCLQFLKFFLGVLDVFLECMELLLQFQLQLSVALLRQFHLLNLALQHLCFLH